MGAIKKAYAEVQEQVAELTGMPAEAVIVVNENVAYVGPWIVMRVEGGWKVSPMSINEAREAIERAEWYGIDTVTAAIALAIVTAYEAGARYGHARR
jgi:hypothetical protein